VHFLFIISSTIWNKLFSILNSKVLKHQRAALMSELPPDKQTKTYPVATNRLFLVTKCTLGRRVFINCAGFIRFDVDNISKEIDEDEDNDYEKNTEILDSTRIHPEHYEWARKMAIDALAIRIRRWRRWLRIPSAWRTWIWMRSPRSSKERVGEQIWAFILYETFNR